MKTISEEIILGSKKDFPAARVFYFHADITNLQKVQQKSGPASHLVKLELKRVDYPFEVGAEFEILVKILLFFKINWKLKIIHNDPEKSFTDQETSGLFKYFAHQHDFLERQEETIIRDQIQLETNSKFWDFFWSIIWKIFLKQKLKTTKRVLQEEFSEK